MAPRSTRNRIRYRIWKIGTLCDKAVEEYAVAMALDEGRNPIIADSREELFNAIDLVKQLAHDIRERV